MQTTPAPESKHTIIKNITIDYISILQQLSQTELANESKLLKDRINAHKLQIQQSANQQLILSLISKHCPNINLHPTPDNPNLTKTLDTQLTIFITELNQYITLTTTQYNILLDAAHILKATKPTFSFTPKQVINSTSAQSLVIICTHNLTLDVVINKIRKYFRSELTFRKNSEHETEITVDKIYPNYVDALNVFREFCIYTGYAEEKRIDILIPKPIDNYILINADKPVIINSVCSYIEEMYNPTINTTTVINNEDNIADTKADTPTTTTIATIIDDYDYSQHVDVPDDDPIAIKTYNEFNHPTAIATRWILYNRPIVDEPTTDYYKRYCADNPNNKLHNTRFNPLVLQLTKFTIGKHLRKRVYKLDK